MSIALNQTHYLTQSISMIQVNFKRKGGEGSGISQVGN